MTATKMTYKGPRLRETANFLCLEPECSVFLDDACKCCNQKACQQPAKDELAEKIEFTPDVCPVPGCFLYS